MSSEGGAVRRRGGGGAAANPSVLSNGPSAPRSKRKRQQKPQPFAYDVPTHTRVAAVSLCCFVASLCLYGNTAFAEFVWDDRAAVPGNKDLRAESPWGNLLIHDFWGQDITVASSHKSFRPVTVASYRLQYALHGPDPVGYHVGNILLNAVVSALVPVLAAKLTGSVTRAAVAGALFALHPVHVEAVACIVGRAELMGTLFYILACLTYLRMLDLQQTATSSWYWGWAMLAASLLLLTLAIFSKENGITALAAFVMFEMTYRSPGAATTGDAPPPAPLLGDGLAANDGATPDVPDGAHAAMRDGGAGARAPDTGSTSSSSSAAASSSTTATTPPPPAAPAGPPSVWQDFAWAADLTADGALRLATVFLYTAMVMTYRVSVHAGAPLYSWTILENQMSLMEPSLSRSLTVLYTHALYGQLMVFPKDLAFDWGFATIKPISGATDPRNLATVLAYVVLLWCVYASVRRRSTPALWGLVAAVASFVPASNLFLWVGTELAERLLYMPSVGLAIAASVLVPVHLPAWLAACWHYVPGVSAVSRQQLTTVHPAVKGVNRRWAFLLVAVVLCGFRSHLRTLDWLQEVRVYESGIETCPDSVKALNNMAYLLLEGGPDDWQRAEPMLLRAVEIWPDHSSAFFNLAILGIRWGDPPKTMHYLWQSVGAGYPTPGNVFTLLGERYLAFHMEHQLSAVPDWAVEAGGAPAARWIADNVPPSENRNAPLVVARYCFEEASRKGVVSAKQFLGRGNVARELGYLESAVNELQQAIATGASEDGQDAIVGSAHNMLGLTYLTMGEQYVEQASAAYRASVSLGLTDPSLYSNAANFFARHGDIPFALQLHEKAVSLEPDNAVLINNYGFACELAGDVPRALTAYRQALALAPSHALIANNVAKMEGLLKAQQQQQQQ